MKVINYKCTLCENIWTEDFVFGVDVDEESGEVKLVEADGAEKHLCRNCIIAIKGQVNEDS